MQVSKNEKTMLITTVKNNGTDASFFSEREIHLDGLPARMLSEQINAVNFRLRTSDSSYTSSWHVAGDSTLLIILTGCVRISLRDGSNRNFSAGQMFIADDYLHANIEFDKTIHGHRADIIGEEEFSALHLKLEKRDI